MRDDDATGGGSAVIASSDGRIDTASTYAFLQAALQK